MLGVWFVGFTIVSQTTEKVEDTNPAVWARAAEEGLRKGQYSMALADINKAIDYSAGSIHYCFQKVKMLCAMKKYQECMIFLTPNVERWYSSLEDEKKCVLVECCREIGEWQLREIKSLYQRRSFDSCILMSERILHENIQMYRYAKKEKNEIEKYCALAYLRVGEIIRGIKMLFENPKYTMWKAWSVSLIAVSFAVFASLMIKEQSDFPKNKVANEVVREKELQKRVPVLSQTNNVAIKPNIPETKRVPAISFNDMELGAICLGDNISKVQRTLGREKLKENRKNGYEFYSYNTMEVGIKNNKVMALVSNGKSVVTKRNIREGSSLNEVLAAYGKDYLLTDFENLNLYEYNYDVNNNSKAILRFAVNKASQKVDYISLRMD